MTLIKNYSDIMKMEHQYLHFKSYNTLTCLHLHALTQKHNATHTHHTCKLSANTQESINVHDHNNERNIIQHYIRVQQLNVRGRLAAAWNITRMSCSNIQT